MKKNVVMLLGRGGLSLILIGFLKDWVYLGDPSILKIRDLWDLAAHASVDPGPGGQASKHLADQTHR